MGIKDNRCADEAQLQRCRSDDDLTQWTLGEKLDDLWVSTLNYSGCA